MTSSNYYINFYYSFYKRLKTFYNKSGDVTKSIDKETRTFDLETKRLNIDVKRKETFYKTSNALESKIYLCYSFKYER